MTDRVEGPAWQYDIFSNSREVIATAAMQGLLSDADNLIEFMRKDHRFKIGDGRTNLAEVVAMNAVEFADALLAELTK